MYLVAYRKKHIVSDKLQIFVYPLPFDDLEQAELKAQEISKELSAPAWLWEVPEPEFRAPLKLVN